MRILRNATAAIVVAAGCLFLSSCNENNPYAAAAYGTPGAPIGKNWDKNGDGRIQSHDNRDWGYRTNANYLDQYTY